MKALLDSVPSFSPSSSSSLHSLSPSRTYAPRGPSMIPRRCHLSHATVSNHRKMLSESYVPCRALRPDRAHHGKFTDSNRMEMGRTNVPTRYLSVPTPSGCSSLVNATLRAHRSSPSPLTSWNTHTTSIGQSSYATSDRDRARTEGPSHELESLYGSSDPKYHDDIDMDSPSSYLTLASAHAAASRLDKTFEPHSRRKPLYTDEDFDTKLKRAYEGSSRGILRTNPKVFLHASRSGHHSDGGRGSGYG